MLLFHPGLLLCLVLLSIAWPFGATVAMVCAVVVVLGYGYLVFVPMRLSRFTGQRRRVTTTAGLLLGVVVCIGVFLGLMDGWGARWFLRWPAAFMASYYAGAIVTTLALFVTRAGTATRP